MQDRQEMDDQENSRQVFSSEEFRDVAEIKVFWQSMRDLSPDMLEQLITAVPLHYREMAIQVVAEQFLIAMKAHILQLVVRFYRHAEEEGINVEDRDEILQEVEANIREIMHFSQQLNIESLKSLFNLGKITLSAIHLSESSTAEEAQGWLDDLPVIYQSRLKDEHLIKQELAATMTFSARSEIIPTHVKYGTQQLSSSQTIQSEVPISWRKILPFPQQPGMNHFKIKTTPGGMKQSLSS